MKTNEKAQKVSAAPYDWSKDPEKRVAMNKPLSPERIYKKRGLAMVINYIDKLKLKEEALLVQIDDIRAQYKEIERAINNDPNNR
jgi:hypothetical protein